MVNFAVKKRRRPRKKTIEKENIESTHAHTLTLNE